VVTADDVFEQAMIRQSPTFIDLPLHGVRVDIGGGNKIMAGWERLDWPDWDAEDKSPLPYVTGLVDAFYCAHALDHISPDAVVYLLAEIDRCLKPGGTFTIVVPHFMSTLAMECIEHRSRYGIKTWRNILDNPAYAPHYNGGHEWNLTVGYNRIVGVEERNLVLVTQLVKNGS
jgi:SAM-dependent methyltransferase